MKLLFQQDESALDGFVTFENQFKELTGLTVREATKQWTSLSTKYEAVYINGKFRLTYSVDDPYWKLYDMTITTTDEQIARMLAARVHTAIYAELSRSYLWMMQNQIPVTQLKEFLDEFVDPANKLAQEALDSWIEIAPEK